MSVLFFSNKKFKIKIKASIFYQRPAEHKIIALLNSGVNFLNYCWCLSRATWLQLFSTLLKATAFEKVVSTLGRRSNKEKFHSKFVTEQQILHHLLYTY
jgi:hypothetical protein